MKQLKRRHPEKKDKSVIWLHLSAQDKRFYGIFALVCAITAGIYALTGGSNIFIVPAMLCIVLYWRKTRSSTR